MFCTKCGEKFQEGTRFCIKCGTAVNTATAPDTPPTAEGFGAVTPEQMRANTAQGLAEQTMAEMQASYRDPPKTAKLPKNKNTKRNGLIVIGSVIILSLVFLFFRNVNGNYSSRVLIGTTWSIDVEEEGEDLGVFIFEPDNVVRSDIFGGYVNGKYSFEGFKTGTWSLDQKNKKLIITIMETDIEEWKFEYNNITKLKMDGIVFENGHLLGKTTINKKN